MQVIFHTGVHDTDNDRLLKCLLRNSQKLTENGVAVPGPGRYRDLLADSFNAMVENAPARDARDILVDAIIDDPSAERLVLSNAFFFGSKRNAIRNGQLYPDAADRLGHLCQLFSGDQVVLFMGLRNPASLLPAVIEQTGPDATDDVLGTQSPQDLRWSDCIARIRHAVPDMQLTLWCNEDTPLIWSELVREIAGLAANEPILGGYDLLSEIMSKEGMERFESYLESHPEMTEMQTRRVITAFLDKFALDEMVEEEVDLEGWTEALIDQLTEQYEEDLFEIGRMPGVTLLSP